MKSPFIYRQIMVALLVLALAQLACGAGSQPSSDVTQPTTSSGSPATQPPAAAATSEHGTPDEARAMLQQAIAHYNSVGRNQALADFNGRVSPFFDRDLYVACVDARLIISANGGFPNLVGSAVEPFSRAVWDAAPRDKIGSIDYVFIDPVTKNSEPKTFYYEKVGTDVCGVGVYHP